MLVLTRFLWACCILCQGTTCQAALRLSHAGPRLLQTDWSSSCQSNWLFYPQDLHSCQVALLSSTVYAGWPARALSAVLPYVVLYMHTRLHKEVETNRKRFLMLSAMEACAFCHVAQHVINSHLFATYFAPDQA